ncbi:CapA family protein [Paenibacillus tarimensis]|uniref:CapA family protein n=1 Tax=Paenibacillus tarimensis TaxID=416012 RepID=UPI001F359F3E|nr:CapA family protein [Paenibacillus tarimensis]MCF2942624.1 CapA family protein [Paenibacillus tarimensis]
MLLLIIALGWNMLRSSPPPQPTEPSETLNEAPPASDPNNSSTGNPQPQQEIDEEQPPPGQTKPKQSVQAAEAVWLAVGDIMVHMPQLPGSYDQTTDSYDFQDVFEPVTGILRKGDWVLANLEAPLDGDHYSGFPRFNAPYEIAEALKGAGITIVTTANNHALDQGYKGIERTLAHLNKLGLYTKGTARSRAESRKAILIEQNGITMGLLAYTYGTNGIPLPSGKPYAVSIWDQEACAKDITALRQKGAEFVTVAMHFGTEYETTPNANQRKIASAIIQAGGDIVAGSHPHVVQPYEVVSVQDADGRKRQGVILYSMGNFISNQRGDTKDNGVIFEITVRREAETGQISFENITPHFTWVHRHKEKGKMKYRILPMEEMLQKRSDRWLSSADYKQMKEAMSVLTRRMEKYKAAS